MPPPYRAFLGDSGPLGVDLDDVMGGGVGVVDGGGSVAGFGGGFVGECGGADLEVETCSEGHGRFRFGLCSPAWSMIRGRQPEPGSKGAGFLDHSQGGVPYIGCSSVGEDW